MNIKILDSWLREHLKTKATPKEIAEKLSLTSLSVERIEEVGKDFLYEMEITTNRIDLFSVIGIAKEAAAILPQFGINAEFIPLTIKKENGSLTNLPIVINTNPVLVNRVCAVLMEVDTGKSNPQVQERLETSGIRSLNNVIDVTNYVMRTLGHPSHVFDFDRLNTKKLAIREAKKGERIKTLDAKEYTLLGGEIIAENEKGEIVDLLGIMGLSNSIVTEETKRILYFIDNNNPHKIRNASMSLGIRSEAATINEKGIDPELSMDAMLYGIELFEKYASAKQISKVLDIYPNKPKNKTINVSLEKINKIIGVEIDIKKSLNALSALDFKPRLLKDSVSVDIPTNRLDDMEHEEDVIEEIARIYGYHNLSSILPQNGQTQRNFFADDFYWEKRVKNTMKYWGFTEVLTYSFVSQSLFDGPIENAVEISNPLTEDFVFMRNSLVPSLLNVINENKNFEQIKIFEIANVYIKNANKLPEEIPMFSGIYKKDDVSFYEVKGTIEQLLSDLGINNISFKNTKDGGIGASLYLKDESLGQIEVLDSNLIDFELNFKIILKHASINREYVKFAKYPPIVEDLTLVLEQEVKTEDVINEIKKQDKIIVDVYLKDTYEQSRTFHITYQSQENNLTKEDILTIRTQIIKAVEKHFNAKIG